MSSLIGKWQNQQHYIEQSRTGVWLDTKIEKSIGSMLQHETDKSVPILVHTDLKVVDQELAVLGESFFKYRALNPDITDLRHLLIQNNVTV